jgi:hypothetical protein
MGIKSLEQLEKIFTLHGVSRLYIKQLAPNQDNDKNQIYLGSSLDGAANLFQSKIYSRSASESIAKRKSSKGQPKLEALLNFVWLDSTGLAFPAPNTRIIDYFQYPEIRLSGFLKGCANPPDSLRRTNQDKYGKRILILGVNPRGNTFGFVLTEMDDPIVSFFPDYPDLPAIPILKVHVIGTAIEKSPRELLINELAQIHLGGWYLSIMLKSGCSTPEPFKGNQGGGYTLEALLGVTANADKKPDKYGYEIKSWSGGKISLMTPVADTGYEGEHTFREFMQAYGRAGQAGDGRRVFTGVHRCESINTATGYTLMLEGYDPDKDHFSDNADEISIALVNPLNKERISVWTMQRLLDSWNKKHTSACYIK